MFQTSDKSQLLRRVLWINAQLTIVWTHWQILRWNVSKSWLQKVDFFENYAIVAMQSDNANFYACKIIKVTSGFDFKKTFFSARGRHHPKNSWNIFQIQITPLFWRPQGPQGCLEKQNCPLSSNLAVWCAKIGPKTQKLQKTVKKPSFFVVFLVISEVFQTFKLLGPILAHQTTKFELSGWFCFSRHPWGPWGSQNSGMKPKSADSVTVHMGLPYTLEP